MLDENLIRNNIQALRKAYGETQDQLGDAIHVGKSAIHNYENGKRKVPTKKLAAIADHYMVSFEELTRSDLSGIAEIQIELDEKRLFGNLTTLMPIFASSTLLSNRTYAKALGAHQELYRQLREGKLDNWDSECEDILGYLEGFEDEDMPAEAAANFIAFWFLFCLFAKTASMAYETRPAILSLINSARIAEGRVAHLVCPDDFAEAQSAAEDFSDPDMQEFINELLGIVYSSDSLYDAAEYYAALQYALGIIDNGLSFNFNRRIGFEMMACFSMMGNPLASRFLDTGASASPHSSQSGNC